MFYGQSVEKMVMLSLVDSSGSLSHT